MYQSYFVYYAQYYTKSPKSTGTRQNFKMDGYNNKYTINYTFEMGKL